MSAPAFEKSHCGEPYAIYFAIKLEFRQMLYRMLIFYRGMHISESVGWPTLSKNSLLYIKLFLC